MNTAKVVKKLNKIGEFKTIKIDENSNVSAIIGRNVTGSKLKQINKIFIKDCGYNVNFKIEDGNIVLVISKPFPTPSLHHAFDCRPEYFPMFPIRDRRY